MKTGFSIIELLLYSALAVVVLTSVSTLYVQYVKTQTKANVIAEVEQQGTYVLQSITQTVRNADTVVYPAEGNTDNRLELTVADLSYDSVVFELENERWWVCKGSGCTPLPLTSTDVKVFDVAVMNLSRDNTQGVVTIRFTVKYNNHNNRYQYAYSKTFYATAALR